MTVIPEMVQEVSAVGRRHAERIAAYARLRFDGLLVTDARREAGVTEESARRYEKWLPLLRDRFGLPDPPTSGAAELPRDFRETGLSGGHQTWHVLRGRSSPDCPLCRGRVS